MIAKLIVSGPTREVTIRKLHAALQDYEVVGLSTNIEFLKKICKSPAFIRGDVETGYIQKHNGELFAPEVVEPEAFAQAALGLLSNELSLRAADTYQGPHAEAVGFGQTNSRQYAFILAQSSEPVQVDLDQSGPNLFQVAVKDSNLEQTYSNVVCMPNTHAISTFFPHTRIDSTLIIDGDKLSLFQHGKQIRMTLSTPGWFEKALGLKDVTNSVLAPMPCKVLRNEVKEGDEVRKDQPLVV